MLPIEEALALVMQKARPLAGVCRPLIDSRGCRLDEEIVADADQPPFDKSLVDGYAVRVIDLEIGLEAPRLRLGQTIMAGQTPTRPLDSGEAALVMTGAPVPAGTDAVVMHELTRVFDDEVHIDDAGAQAGQNLLRKGRICCAGDILLPAGSILNPPALGLLASVGRTGVRVVPRPRMTIVPTGDELVEPDEAPGPGQIRNSNAVMLEALAMDHGALPQVLPIAPDEPAGLLELLEQGLQADVLVVTGGVSAGQRDLVPGVLEELGVERVFHKVRLKPGKPLWFGLGPRRGERPEALVFGLPGNPVSALVGFLVFIKPALRVLAGHPRQMPEPESLRLGSSFVQRGARPAYHPARRVERAGSQGSGVIEILEWAGSADLVGVARADGLAAFPPGDRVFQAGEIVRFLPLG